MYCESVLLSKQGAVTLGSRRPKFKKEANLQLKLASLYPHINYASLKIYMEFTKRSPENQL